MRCQQARLTFMIAAAVAVIAMIPAPTAAQTATSAIDDTWSMPLTAWGDPDLQGIWSFATITPLERPREFQDRAFLSNTEIAVANQNAATRASSERRAELTPERDVALAYNQFWWDRGKSTGRTSLIIDPPDGQVPRKTPTAQARIDAARDVRARNAWGPEDRGGAERCLQYRPLPRLPTGYNNHHQILQTPGYVVILTEMIHNVRVIPLDGRPHIAHTVRLWNGDSRGHWEKDTLVVETTNFNDTLHFQGSGSGRHLVERFTRTAEDTIDWRFTVDDDSAWVRPWTAVLPFTKTDGPIYEYACHERNYGMENLLTIARTIEKR